MRNIFVVFVTSCSALRNLAGLATPPDGVDLGIWLDSRPIFERILNLFLVSPIFQFRLKFPSFFTRKKKLRIKRFKNGWNFFFEQSNIRDKKKRELSQDLDYPKFSTEEASRWPVHFRKVSEETKGKRKSSRGSTEASLIQINRPRFARGRFLRLDREGSKRRRWRRWLAIRDTQEKKNLLPFSLPLPHSFRAINFRFRVSERGGRRHRWPSSRYS